MHSILPGLVAIPFNSESSKNFLSPKRGKTEVFGDKDGAVESFRSVLEPGSADRWLWKLYKTLISLGLTPKEAIHKILWGSLGSIQDSSVSLHIFIQSTLSSCPCLGSTELALGVGGNEGKVQPPQS